MQRKILTRLLDRCIVIVLLVMLGIIGCEETPLEHDHPHEHEESSEYTDPIISEKQQAQHTIKIMERMFNDYFTDVEISEADIAKGGKGGIFKHSKWHINRVVKIDVVVSELELHTDTIIGNSHRSNLHIKYTHKQKDFVYNLFDVRIPVDEAWGRIPIEGKYTFQLKIIDLSLMNYGVEDAEIELFVEATLLE